MEISDYLRAIRLRWKTVVACLAAVLAGTALATFLATPQYSSTATLFLSAQPESLGEASEGELYAQQRASAYATLVSSEELATQVAADVGLQFSASALSAKTSAHVVPGTAIVEISVRDPDPDRAQELAQAYAESFPDLVDELEPNEADAVALEAAIAEPATLPTSPVSPQPVRNLALALAAGLLLGFGVAVLRERLGVRRRTSDDAAGREGGVELNAAPGDRDD